MTSTAPLSFRYLHLKGYPILAQLRLEEALLRTSNENWCLINEGSPEAIVMGISGKPNELVDLNHMQQQPVPLIRRYSGGGTVFVDNKTLFVTLIGNHNLLSERCYPCSLMNWNGELLQSAFPLPNFHLVNNDYAIGQQKCGGNAQYIQRNRWVQHTSFLWSFDPRKIEEYLLMPKRQPKYRQQRSHTDFLRPLEDLVEEQKVLTEGLVDLLDRRYGIVEEKLDSALEHLAQSHRQGTKVVELEKFPMLAG